MLRPLSREISFSEDMPPSTTPTRNLRSTLCSLINSVPMPDASQRPPLACVGLQSQLDQTIKKHRRVQTDVCGLMKQERGGAHPRRSVGIGDQDPAPIDQEPVDPPVVGHPQRSIGLQYLVLYALDDLFAHPRGRYLLRLPRPVLVLVRQVLVARGRLRGHQGLEVIIA